MNHHFSPGRVVAAIIHPARHGAPRVELAVEVTDRDADTIVLPRVTDLPGRVPARVVTLRFGSDRELVAHLNRVARAVHENADRLAAGVDAGFARLYHRLWLIEGAQRRAWYSLHPEAAADAQQLLALAALPEPRRALQVVSHRIVERALAGAGVAR